MKVHWWIPFGDGGPGGRVLCRRPLRSGTVHTRNPHEVTCRVCLRRMTPYLARIKRSST